VLVCSPTPRSTGYVVHAGGVPSRRGSADQRITSPNARSRSLWFYGLHTHTRTQDKTRQDGTSKNCVPSTMPSPPRRSLRWDWTSQIRSRFVVRAPPPPSRPGLLLRQREGHGGGFLPDAAFWGAVAQAIPSFADRPGAPGFLPELGTWWVQAPLSTGRGAPVCAPPITPRVPPGR
jgi:hypothetical protein